MPWGRPYWYSPMEVTISGCRISISVWFAAILAAAAAVDPSGGILCGLLAAIIHELGHLLEMFRQKSLPRRIRFRMFCVDIEDNHRGERSYQRDLRILLAGPALNFLVAAVCFPLSFFIPHQWMGMFFSSNLLIGFFNIQPVATLDGGAALYAFLSTRIGAQKATFWGDVISFVDLVPLAAVGFWILLKNPYQFSLLFISVYLMGMLVLRRIDYL